MPGRIKLSNGDFLELSNKFVKTGKGNVLNGRGVFPLICLSNIRSASEKETFFLNILNGDLNITDFNKDKDKDVKSLRNACPSITSGTEEDAMAVAVGAEILTQKILYNQLMEL